MNTSSQKKRMVIIGGAAGAKIVYDIYTAGKTQVVGFMSNFVPENAWGDIKPVLLGDFHRPENIRLLEDSKTGYFVATGDNYMRAQITREIMELTGKPPENAVHPAAVISQFAQIGNGNLINASAVINVCARIGIGTIINTGSIIEHDNDIGDYSQISPGCNLAGYVKVLKYAFIGTGANIIPKVTIGEGAIVAAGAVVTEDIDDHVMVAGVPAKVKKELCR